MKKLSMLAGIAIIALIVGGCSTVIPMGTLHTNTTIPMQVNTAESIPKDAKVGTSQAVSYFSMVLDGDASIKKAMENGKK